MGKIMHQGVNYSSINDAEHLSNLQDTQISNPADGNILQYDGNTNKWKNVVAQEHTTFNGRSGSILPMAGDYNSDQVILSSIMNIGGQTQSNIQEALEALNNKINNLKYSDLNNLPTVNGDPLTGDLSTEDLVPVGTGLKYDENGTLCLDYRTEANPAGGITAIIG